MRQGTQTRDGPFWAEHYYEPCKSGMIDASGWVIYTTDPETGEKISIGSEVCLPYSLSGYARERLPVLRKRVKRAYTIERCIQGSDFKGSTSENIMKCYIKEIKAIKQSLKNTKETESVSL
jgi:hypothetical protein